MKVRRWLRRKDYMPTAAPPPFHADLDLIASTDSNKRAVRAMRRHADKLNREAGT